MKRRSESQKTIQTTDPQSVGAKAQTACDVPAADYAAENPYMQVALEEARTGIYRGEGGPFGSVIVRAGAIVGQGHNQVLRENDPTCHGELSAIRDACRKLKTYDLTGCVLYTTGEPCPMCLCACMWANIDKVYYGCTIEDNGIIGFRDDKFDQLLGGRKSMRDYLACIDRAACLKLFDEYNAMANRTIY